MKAKAKSAHEAMRTTPLILLWNSGSATDRRELSEWLASSSLTSYEATDTLDAVGYISDFTTGCIPEIVTIPQREQDKTEILSDLVHGILGEDRNLPIFVFSREKGNKPRCMSLDEITLWLQRPIDRGES